MKIDGVALDAASFLVSLLVRLIKLTSSSRYAGFEEYRKRLRRGDTVLIAFWHNQGLFMPFVYFGKSGRIKLIVSQSRDGDLIAALLRWFGILSVRGSSSRGSTAALKELLRLDRKGEDSIVFTPDGPKGPIYRVKDGVAYLALCSRKPLYLLSVSFTRVKILGSWDRFRVPLPFGQATYVCSPPLYFSGLDRRTPLAGISGAIEECLMQVNAIADALSCGAITQKESLALLSPDRLPWLPFSRLPPPPGSGSRDPEPLPFH
jgi:lysophospholipid acyltransferase (LPLAT)-like uncharacterized protein